MKFIISENKLNQLRDKFLNSYVTLGDIRTFDSFIVIEDPSADEFDEPNFEYDYSDGRLFVNKNLRNIFSNLFGLNKEESNRVFKEWFESKFNVDIKFLA